MSKLTVVILTLNEEIHIKRCINNVLGWADKIVVLDSGSGDKTVEIAKSLGVTVCYRKFDNYSAQRNYAINELDFENEWMFFLDADELLSIELKEEISSMLLNENLSGVNGFYINRKFFFLGKWIAHGGLYPAWFLRLFKPKFAKCEREINEHITVEGVTEKLKNTFTDDNLNSFGSWLIKHNKYADFESTQFNNTDVKSDLFGNQSERKQWVRQNIWNKFLPPLIRPFFYFVYSYFFRLGFLDGKIGFIYHFMQGLVYRFMIDVKYIERKNGRTK